MKEVKLGECVSNSKKFLKYKILARTKTLGIHIYDKETRGHSFKCSESMNDDDIIFVFHKTKPLVEREIRKLK